jgi:hypothetical protein
MAGEAREFVKMYRFRVGTRDRVIVFKVRLS